MNRTIIALVFLSFTGLIRGQQTTEVKPKAVIVPADIYLPIIVPQPLCPLQFEKILIVKYLDKRQVEFYEVRNLGQKPIRSYTYAAVTSTDLEEMYSREPSDSIMPNEVMVFPDDTRSIDFVPLTDELRDKLKLRGPMKEAIIFMILNVEFADGSRYDDSAKYDKIREHIRQLRLLEKADDPNFYAEQSLRSLKDYIESIR
jgi:hypothetical protein